MVQTIEDTILCKRDIGTALFQIKKRCSDLDIADGADMLATIESEYQLMCDCFQKGMRDPNGDTIYMSLLKRTYQLYNIVRLASIVKHRSTLGTCKNIAKSINIQDGSVRMFLENFVQESTLVSLRYGCRQSTGQETLYADHQNYMERLFCSILVSGQWSDDTMSAYSQLIVSPTIEPADALLVVSAITLALMIVNDVNKWLTLVYVFENADEETLRQRALLGIALSLPTKESLIFHEVEETMDRLFESEDFRKQLVELQKQLLYCERAEDDSRKFQREILPTFVNKSKNGGSFGTDNIDELIGTDNIDDNVSIIEEKVENIKSMLEQGSDIYFDGFSKMKKFSFFYKLSNWFAPFDINHPDVSAALRGSRAVVAVAHMLEHSPFCDSDKYSFALAVTSVLDKLPNDMSKTIKEGWTMASGHESESESRAFIRRKYIQDFYRFFCLYPGRKDFNDPFEVIGTQDTAPCKRFFFVANRMLLRKYSDEIINLIAFLYEQCRYDLLQLVVRLRHDANVAGAGELLLLAKSYMKEGLYEEAKGLFDVVYSETNSTASLTGVAYSLFMLRRYSEAAIVYEDLLCREPNDSKNILYHALSLVNGGYIEEGMAKIFKLNYDDPDNMDVKRALAWGYLMRANPIQADEIYSMLIDEGTGVVTDILNCAYSKWILSKTEEAVSLFRRYEKKSMEDNGSCSLSDDLNADNEMLEKNGIKDYEKMLIVNLVERN